MLRRLKKSRKGFSLIELLVVLVILALLAGIVLPKFLAQQKKGQRGAAETQIGSFKSSLQLYMLDNNGQPPTSQQGLDALVNEPSSTPRPAKWQKYLTDVNAVPKDPWGNDYVYESPGPGGEDFLITSYGADGRPGGSGDDEDITSTK